MKLVHKNPAPDDGPGEMVKKAKQLEQEGNLAEAAAIYEKLTKKNPVNEQAYDRLMIIHRKNRDYKKEKAVIDTAIKAFEQFYRDSMRVSASSRVKTLSKAILKVTGLADPKTGKLLYEREPLYRWNKRRELVMKKLK